MVGDADQLPSVGPGNLLGEIIRSGCVPTVCLNEIFRQAKRSLIVENAHHIICGEPLQKGGKTDDFFFLEADGDAAQKLVCDLVTTRLPRSYGKLDCELLENRSALENRRVVDRATDNPLEVAQFISKRRGILRI